MKTNVNIDFAVDTTPDKNGTELTVESGSILKNGTQLNEIVNVGALKNGTQLNEISGSSVPKSGTELFISDSAIIKNGIALSEISIMTANKENSYIVP